MVRPSLLTDITANNDDNKFPNTFLSNVSNSFANLCSGINSRAHLPVKLVYVRIVQVWVVHTCTCRYLWTYRAKTLSRCTYIRPKFITPSKSNSKLEWTKMSQACISLSTWSKYSLQKMNQTKMKFGPPKKSSSRQTCLMHKQITFC